MMITWWVTLLGEDMYTWFYIHVWQTVHLQGFIIDIEECYKAIRIWLVVLRKLYTIGRLCLIISNIKGAQVL